MKPIKLIISAFGSYANTMPAIEFEQFSKQGLFLVCGDTGSGKTTIFDAISYALFGEVSGSFRDTKNLRSQYAKDDVISFVEFSFSHQGHQYQIRREPGYERLNRNGNITFEKEKVVFSSETDVIEGIKNVDGDKVIENLLHVNAKQFKQIAMIAQGEFWSVLNEKTEKRTEILRTIFETQKYNELESKLKNLKSDNYREMMQMTDSILQYFSDVQVREDNSFSQNIIALQNDATESGSTWNLDDILTSLTTLIEEDIKKEKEIQADLTKQEEQLSSLQKKQVLAQNNNALLDKVKSLREKQDLLLTKKKEMDEAAKTLEREKKATYHVKPVYDSWMQKQTELTKTKQEYEQLQQQIALCSQQMTQIAMEYEKILQRKPELEQISHSIAKMIEEEPNYEKRDAIKSTLELLHKKEEQLLSSQEKLVQREEQLKKRLIVIEEECKNIEGVPAKQLSVAKELAKYQSLEERLVEILENNLPDYEKSNHRMQQYQEKYLSINDTYLALEDRNRQAKQILDGCRAGILAKALEEGKPCPVCGSVHHTKPAQLPEQRISQSEYDQLCSELDECRIRREDALTKAETAKTTWEHLQKDLLAKICDCFKQDDREEEITYDAIEPLLEQTKQFLARTKEKVLSLTEQADRLEEDAKQIEALRKEEKLLQREKNEEIDKSKVSLAKEISENKEEIVRNHSNLQQLSHLSYPDYQTALQERKRLEEKKNQIEQQMEEKFDAKQKMETKSASLASESSVFVRKAREQERDLQGLQSKLEQVLREQGFAQIEQIDQFLSKQESLEQKEKQIQAYREQLTTIKTQLNDAKNDAEGKEYIDLDSMQEQIHAQSDTVAALRSRSHEIRSIIQNNQYRYQKIQAQQDSLQQSQKKNGHYTRLFQLITGQTGNGKITFEQFVQAYGFDGIIQAANRRLMPMSENQYELRRQSKNVSKRSQTFLDLEVYDHYTGSLRPVGSLSGGESFQASLCLALGLSDTVSSNLGGVQMDALFVDEGFGTLDQKSIDHAMETLLNLAGKNKLVGIISHREELMEMISQKIEVTKTRDGSEMKICTE